MYMHAYGKPELELQALMSCLMLVLGMNSDILQEPEVLLAAEHLQHGPGVSFLRSIRPHWHL